MNKELSKGAERLKATQDLLADAQEQSGLYALRLNQQIAKLSEARAQNLELEAQLSWQAEEIKKLRRSLWEHLKDIFRSIVSNDPAKETLANEQASTDGASVELNSKASLTAFPRQVPVGRIMGATEINWTTGDDSEGEVYVSINGEPETLFVAGPAGSKEAPWILPDQTYDFRLYAGTGHTRLLDEVRVIGVRMPDRDSRDVMRGFLDPPVQDLNETPYLEVSGWAYSKEAPILWVEAFLDNVPLGLMKYGEPRSDVPTDPPSLASIDCGFSGRFSLNEFLARPTTLLVRVADARGNMKDLRAASSPDAALLDVLSASKDVLDGLARISLDSFLASNSIIEFPSHATPKVSIILVLYNRAELTLPCLYSILRSDVDSYEVVIVDNASTDETPSLLAKIKGAEIVRNGTNLHFLRACNQAAKKARGKYILLLNNDAQLVAGSISTALRTLNSSSDIGAVGGKIILPDGTLQEAGSIIWQDGSCLGYGRGDSPFAPAYMHKRDVDYCSGAFLLTYRELFLEDGGFDEDYSPAYYEETDYCVRLWKRGMRVVYDPNVIIFHYEFASASSQRSAIDLQIEHRKIFANKHRDWLQPQQAAAPVNILAARAHVKEGQRQILFLDDCVPHLTLGRGFPRSNRILTELVNLGHAVTFYPTLKPLEEWSDVYQDIPSEVEVMLECGLQKLRDFLYERSHYYDLILISRPHNMAPFKSVLAENPNLCGRARIIYDAEALSSYREIEQRRLGGQELSKVEQAQLISDEMSLTDNCDCVVSVSDRESREFSRHGPKQVHTLGHSVEIAPTPNDFEERQDILFVGAIPSLNSPNADSMIWFSEDILPLIQESLGKDVKLVIAGLTCPEFQARFNNGSIQLVGKVDDLVPLYNRARLFVAPTRFSAGIPLKVCEAAAHGLPTVATSLTGLQLGWDHERELLLADNPQDFAEACIRLYEDSALWHRLRDTMIERAREDFSPEIFSKQLKLIIE
ncbi:MAG: glycosyltransferase [Acidobacteriota bacterium]